MKKPKFLYHGSSSKIEGKLIPRKATDLDEMPENMHTAVYATGIRKLAIAMAICKSTKMSGRAQWISLKPVKPIKIKKILVKNYVNLVRKATKAEKIKFL